jgi:hypothetical protein
MRVDSGDLVQIDSSGAAQPQGERAALRLQARSGTYRVVASPPDVVVMLRDASGGGVTRPCILAGQVRSPGALCELLSFAAHTGTRGEFLVHDDVDGTVRSVYFDEGHVVAAQSTAVHERLGEVLYRHGVLTREQVTACAEAAADRSTRFGEAAVKLGLLRREEVFARMTRQTEEIFYGMLLVGQGMFYFLDGFAEEQLSWRDRLSVGTLIRDGIRRMHEMRYFRARIPSEHHVPARVEQSGAPAADPLGVYAAIDGARSVQELSRVVGVGDFELTRVLFQLVQSGHVVIKPPRLSPNDIVEVFNGAIAVILRELDAMDEGDPIREQLAKFAADRSPAPLLAGAGPADDGTLDGARIALNLAAAGDPRAVEILASWLYEFASYALFLARPHLRRRHEGEQENNRKPRLSARVSALLDPIAPISKRGGA